jgi:hypothetical protein
MIGIELSDFNGKQQARFDQAPVDPAGGQRFEPVHWNVAGAIGSGSRMSSGGVSV